MSPVKNHKPFALLSGSADMRPTPAIFKSRPVGIQNGIYAATRWRLFGGGYIVTMDGAGHHVGKWDLLIAHPPCTYLTNAGAVRMTVKGELQRERYEKAMAARDFFMQMWTASVERIAIENPTPMGIVKLPPPTQVIQPFQFGHPYSKRTCLWLKNLPTLIPTSFISNYEPYVNGGCKDAYGRYRRFQGRNERDQKTRSKTFPGIAAAMADQLGTHGGYVQMTLLEEIEE